MTNFTPWSSLFGGLLIGFASLLLLYQGRICGISGIYKGILQSKRTNNLWRYLFIIGLIFGGFFLNYFYPEVFPSQINNSIISISLGGFLVGVGTSIGGGCTSGHGVCGMGRLSVRSIIASMTFLLFGILTASIAHYLQDF